MAEPRSDLTSSQSQPETQSETPEQQQSNPSDYSSLEQQTTFDSSQTSSLQGTTQESTTGYYNQPEIDQPIEQELVQETTTTTTTATTTKTIADSSQMTSGGTTNQRNNLPSEINTQQTTTGHEINVSQLQSLIDQKRQQDQEEAEAEEDEEEDADHEERHLSKLSQEVHKQSQPHQAIKQSIVEQESDLSATTLPTSHNPALKESSHKASNQLSSSLSVASQQQKQQQQSHQQQNQQHQQQQQKQQQHAAPPEAPVPRKIVNSAPRVLRQGGGMRRQGMPPKGR
eukprot:TRINITY_DN4632_c0_g1_i1.p1 TRINITY_DN4632_c0_g1~~TRINITY_DN4632_c0_g1_i1.p1  ORF type:complete len:320 (+),score=106.64 TRINITY_DN4632_c0_g1_i1:107-961(+)